MIVKDVSARELARVYCGEGYVNLPLRPSSEIPVNSRWLVNGELVIGSGGPAATHYDRVLRRVRQDARRTVRAGMARAGFYAGEIG